MFVSTSFCGLAIDGPSTEIKEALDQDAAGFAERTRLELESAAADVSMWRMLNVLKPLYKPAQHSAAC